MEGGKRYQTIQKGGKKGTGEQRRKKEGEKEREWAE